MAEQRDRSRASRERRNRPLEDAKASPTQVVLVQMCIVGVILASILVVKVMGLPLFDSVRGAYAEAFESNETFAAITETFNNLKNEIPKVQEFLEQFFGGKDGDGAKTSSKAGEGKSEVSENGMGGELPTVALASGTKLAPPAKATFSPAYITAHVILPVENAHLSSDYGYRFHPITGTVGFHYGMDLAAATGTNIRAAMAGVVKTVGYNASRGNYVVLSHGSNIETWYQHCSEVLVTEGTNLRQGETIAHVGSTGDSTGPHCHFEIKIDGINIDPNWVVKRSDIS